MIRSRLGPAIGADPRWLEMASAAGAVIWGAIALLRPDTIEWPSVYAMLSLFVGPRLMGLAMVVIGVLQAAAVLLDHQLARIPFAAGAASCWLLVAWFVVRALVATPSIAGPLVLGIGDGAAVLVLIRLYHRSRAP